MFPPELFPKLEPDGYLVTSPESPAHNCIGFAVGDYQRWWWPVQGPALRGGPVCYWPEGCPLDDSIAAFDRAFATLGFRRANNIRPELEVGIQKIAIYARDGRVKHAARQWPNGRWRSKMGEAHDIEHELYAVEGPFYGSLVAIYEQFAEPVSWIRRIARLVKRL